MLHGQVLQPAMPPEPSNEQASVVTFAMPVTLQYFALAPLPAVLHIIEAGQVLPTPQLT
jgi:hypothetical protein